jgi:hypothetical protein
MSRHAINDKNQSGVQQLNSPISLMLALGVNSGSKQKRPPEGGLLSLVPIDVGQAMRSAVPFCLRR